MKYTRPATLGEALHLLEATGDGATLLAGGTDLVPRWEQEAPLPQLLVDLKRVPELRGIRRRREGLEIGALSTMHDLLESAEVRRDWPALAASARDFAGVQIRHRATLGGNLCNASPAADTAPPLLAFGAVVRLAGPKGERELPLADFLLGPGQTALRPGELLVSLRLPRPEPLSRFVKVGLRDAMAIAVVNLAAAGEVEGGRFRRLVLAAGAVAPTVVALRRCAEAMVNDPKDRPAALEAVSADIAPIDDIRATAGYRARVLRNAVEMTLTSMLEGSVHE